jgi:hypothetical protein
LGSNTGHGVLANSKASGNIAGEFWREPDFPNVLLREDCPRRLLSPWYPFSFRGVSGVVRGGTREKVFEFNTQTIIA